MSVPLLVLMSFTIVIFILMLFALVKISRSARGERELILRLDVLEKTLEGIEKQLRDEFMNNREEMRNALRDMQKDISGSLTLSIKEFGDAFDKNVQSFNELQREKFTHLDEKQEKLIQQTEKRLDQMRETVDEKLQKTLNERIGQSFETVGKQLEEVQKGLGEMRNLAQDVGGLKKVLSNVKQRGGIGEVQLGMLLEQMLAPDQFETNVRTRPGSSDNVEFAIRLPGREEAGKHVYLPIDAKFPRDVYEAVADAYEGGDPSAIEAAIKVLEQAIKKMAKDISEKYLEPPYTTDFAIMFLPFESIYAEVIRRSALIDQLQREYRVVVTGPMTLAAILNSLQMGFRTLHLQKRSSEVWAILGAVKTEFEKFGGLLEKAQKNITTAGGAIDELMGKRTSAIKRKLREVGSLPVSESVKLLPELATDDAPEEE